MIPITRPELPDLDLYIEHLREIWGSRMLSNFATFAQQMERMTTDYLGAPTMVAVSGDVGLMLAIKALDLPAGGTVLVSPFTFNSTINAVLWNGLTPVFTDIDAQSFNMSPAAAEEAAALHHPHLILATHVFGNPADADGLRAVADHHGARLMFDAAHGYGSLRAGTHVGALGDVEVFSLSGTKPVTSAEGGLISTSDAGISKRIRYLRGYGFLNDYNSLYVGMNGKMSELHAALGLLSLARIEDAVSARHALVARYRELLRGLPLREQEVRSLDRSTYKDFSITFESEEERQRTEVVLAEREIQTKRYFRPCHVMPAYRDFPAMPVPVTEDVYRRTLCLPAFESLTIDEQAFVATSVREALA